jgi:hypothetical protein
LLAGLAAALGLAGVLFARARRRPAPVPDLLAAARSRLDALRAREPRGREESRAFHVEAASIAREWLAGRAGVSAPEATTDELLDRAAPELATAQRDLLGDLLARCDLAKFTGDEPSPGARAELLAIAARLVEAS